MKNQKDEDKLFSSSLGIETASQKIVRETTQAIVRHMKEALSRGEGGDRRKVRDEVTLKVNMQVQEIKIPIVNFDQIPPQGW